MQQSDSTLKSALDGLIATRRLQGDRGYGKAELLSLLRESVGDSADAAFARLRLAARGSGAVAGFRVRAEGERRGCVYFFEDAGVDPIQGAASGHEHANGQMPESAPSARRYVAPSAPKDRGRIEIHYGDNLPIISAFPSSSFDLIYIDPPFNTGKKQARTQISTVLDEEGGDRVGFKGKRYRTTRIGTKAFGDVFDDYLAFLEPRLEQAHRLLKPTGSLFLHLDFREVHYAKVLLDQIFGRESFINEIIWAYDYGARATRRWSPKHDNILWYARDPERYCFNFDAIDRIPYMAPDLVGEEKAARGKTPTDTWWHTIVSPNGHEKTGYPTQKPLGILRRLVTVHSNVGDRLLDFFGGSGTLGEAGAGLGRDVVLVDSNPEALDVMVRRLKAYEPRLHGVDARPTEPSDDAGDAAAASAPSPPHVADERASAKPHLVAERAVELAEEPAGRAKERTARAARRSAQASLFE